jgi:hypothetical protein
LRNLAASIQEAPNAQAYLASGAIQGLGQLVDVKKVIVIGSGGLSIGQAGEFDYSGMWLYFFTGQSQEDVEQRFYDALGRSVLRCKSLMLQMRFEVLRCPFIVSMT